jgi:Tfp pilus assembly protein PilZ
MAIKTNYPVRVGEELTVEFKVPNVQRPLKVAAEVTWRKFHGDSPGQEETLFTAGIKFLNPQEAYRTILYEHIKRSV